MGNRVSDLAVLHSPVMSMLNNARAQAHAPEKLCLAFSRMGFSHGDLFKKVLRREVGSKVREPL